MIILPYVYTSKHISPQLIQHKILVLCEGGQTPWVEDNQPIQHVLDPNDIVPKEKIETYNDYTIVEVDTKKTDMNSMYTWSELPLEDKSTLCWRTFVCFTNTDMSCWLTLQNSPFKSILSVILKTRHGIIV